MKCNFFNNLQTAFGTPVTSKDGVTCKFSYDPTVALILGYLSVAFLVASNVAGCLSLFYLRRSLSPGVLFKGNDFKGFMVNVSLIL